VLGVLMSKGRKRVYQLQEREREGERAERERRREILFYLFLFFCPLLHILTPLKYLSTQIPK
jgi:hypothetical protein